MSNLQTIKSKLNSESSIEKFQEMLGNNARAYITSVISTVSQNQKLQSCDPNSLLMAVGTAASLDLPINPNLGFAYIVPYKDQAQFQIGYKGLIQLCQRSGMFKAINSSDVKEGEIKRNDRLTGHIEFEWIEDDLQRDKQKTCGYVAYFELLNGFSKHLYMPITNIESHAKKYSMSYKKNYGVWKDDFDSMAKKTVIKLLLGKYAPMTVEIQNAINYDQSVQDEQGNITYVDNEKDKNVFNEVVSLIPTAKIDTDKKNNILSGLKNKSKEDLEKELNYLLDNQ